MASSLRVRDAYRSRLQSIWGSSTRQLVTFDKRGTGYSDRDVRDFSMETVVADYAAVVDAIGGGPVAVAANWEQGPVAMRFAAEFPDRVSHLLLDSTSAHGADIFATIPAMRSMLAVLEIDWDFFLRVACRVTMDFEHPISDEIETAMRDEMSHEATLAQWRAVSTYDATDCLSAISVPTLLVQRTGVGPQMLTHESMRDLAKQIPGSVLARSESAGESNELIDEFLGSGGLSDETGSFRTIMFTDLVSSTALTQQLGDDAAQQIVEAHDSAVRDALSAHNGVQIKHTGDGVMAAFASATDGALAANQINAALANQRVGVRIGLNAGEPIERHGDLFGTAVQLAARVCDAAATGQVLATHVVRDLTAGKGLAWSPAPAIEAKGFDEHIAVFSLDLA